jgi:hypothetical protein
MQESSMTCCRIVFAVRQSKTILGRFCGAGKGIVVWAAERQLKWIDIDWPLFFAGAVAFYTAFYTG